MKKFFQIKENDFSSASEYTRRATSIYYSILVAPILSFAMFFLIEGIEDGTKGVLGISPLTSLGMMISFILIWVQAYKNRNQSLKELKKEVSKRAFIELYYVNFRLFVVLAGTFWLASILFLLTKDAFVVILFTMAMGVCSFEIPNLSRFLKQLQVKKEDRKRLMRGESIE